jgi:L-asparagine transporter-like permease
MNLERLEKISKVLRKFTDFCADKVDPVLVIICSGFFGITFVITALSPDIKVKITFGIISIIALTIGWTSFKDAIRREIEKNKEK